MSARKWQLVGVVGLLIDGYATWSARDWESLEPGMLRASLFALALLGVLMLSAGVHFGGKP